MVLGGTNVDEMAERRSVDHLASVAADRRGVLDTLASTPRTKPRLVDDLDVSRSTVDRAIRDLETAGLVVSEAGAYRATAVGRCVLRARTDYRDRLESIRDAEAVLRSLPRETSLGNEFVAGAEVAEAVPHAPDDVIGRLFDSVAAADEVVGFAPVAMTGLLSGFHDSVLAGGGRLRIVVKGDRGDHLFETEPAEMRRTADVDRVELFRGEVPHSFGLWIADDREAGVVVYTDAGPKGVLANDDPAAVRWARDCYESVLDDAALVDVDAAELGE